jgi:hypothetical protein
VGPLEDAFDSSASPEKHAANPIFKDIFSCPRKGGGERLHYTSLDTWLHDKPDTSDRAWCPPEGLGHFGSCQDFWQGGSGAFDDRRVFPLLPV